MCPSDLNPDISFGSMVIRQEDYEAVKINNSEALGRLQISPRR